jgi:hypothetical protein
MSVQKWKSCSIPEGPKGRQNTVAKHIHHKEQNIKLLNITQLGEHLTHFLIQQPIRSAL